MPHGYAGARREDAVGLYLMGARWYDPSLGRFIEQDPIGEEGGMNLYAYTASSPVMWTDPSGLCPMGNPYSPQGTVWEQAQRWGISVPQAYARQRTITEQMRKYSPTLGGLLAMESRQLDKMRSGNGAAPNRTDSETAAQQQSGAVEPTDQQTSGAPKRTGVGIEPAEGEDPKVVDEWISKIESAIGISISKNESGRYQGDPGPVEEDKQPATAAFDRAAKEGVDFKVASWSPNGDVDSYDAQTVYVDVVGEFPTEAKARGSKHAITQEEIVAHILYEYAVGKSKGFAVGSFDNAHESALSFAQNPYRRKHGRSEIDVAESSRNWRGPFRLYYGPGKAYTFSYADGTSSDFSIWPGSWLKRRGTSIPDPWD